MGFNQVLVPESLRGAVPGEQENGAIELHARSGERRSGTLRLPLPIVGKVEKTPKRQLEAGEEGGSVVHGGVEDLLGGRCGRLAEDRQRAAEAIDNPVFEDPEIEILPAL